MSSGRRPDSDKEFESSNDRQKTDIIALTHNISELSVDELITIVGASTVFFKNKLLAQQQEALASPDNMPVTQAILDDMTEELNTLSDESKCLLTTLKKQIDPNTRVALFEEALVSLEEIKAELTKERDLLRVFVKFQLGDEANPVKVEKNLNYHINDDQRITQTIDEAARKERIARLKRDYVTTAQHIIDNYNRINLDTTNGFYNTNVDRLAITTKNLVALLQKVDHPQKIVDLIKQSNVSTEESALSTLVEAIRKELSLSEAIKNSINRYDMLSTALRSFNRIAGDASRADLDNDLLSILAEPSSQIALRMPVLVFHAENIKNIGENAELTAAQKNKALFDLINDNKDKDKEELQKKIADAKSLNDICAIYQELLPQHQAKIDALFKQQVDLCKQERDDLLSQYNIQKGQLLAEYKKLNLDLNDDNIPIILGLFDETNESQKILQIALRQKIKTAIDSNSDKNLEEKIINLEETVKLVYELKEEYKEKEDEQLNQYKEALTIKEPGLFEKAKDWLTSQFQTGKKLVDVADDAWYAMRGLLGPTIVNQYGNYIVGVASGTVAMAEASLGVQEARHAMTNVNEPNAVSAGIAGSATAVTAGTALLASALIVGIAVGLPVFGALTATVLPALAVIVPVLMAATYGIKLIRDAYHLHVAKGEEHEADEKLKEAKEALETAKRNYTNSATQETRNALFLAQNNVQAHQKVQETARKERLTTEREVGFSATEFATSAIVATGIILGTAALVGITLATAGVGTLALSTLVLIVGVGCGFGAKYFQKKDEEAGYAYTSWMRDKLVSAATWLGLNKNEPVLAAAAAPSIPTSAPADSNGYNSAAIQKTLEKIKATSELDNKPNPDPVSKHKTGRGSKNSDQRPAPAGTVKTLTSTGGPGTFAPDAQVNEKEKKAPSLGQKKAPSLGQSNEQTKHQNVKSTN